MSTDVKFPGLGLSFTLNRVAFTLFGLDIYWYGLLIGLGLLLAVWFAYRKAKVFGVDFDKMLDAVIGGTIAGVIGARLYYVVFSDMSILDFFKFREGGLAFYGAVIFAALVAIPLCRWKKIKFLPTADMLAIGFAIGQGVGRWGNFFNQEAFGVNTKLPWGMISTLTTDELGAQAGKLLEKGIMVDPALPVHPIFLYESIACLLSALLLILYIKRRRFDGEIALMYVAWNGVIRKLLEGLRTDSLYLGNIRISQLLAAVGAVAAITLIVTARIKIKRVGDPAYLIPYAKTPAWEAELATIEARRAKKRDQQKSKAVDQEITDADAPGEEKTEETAETPADAPPENAATESTESPSENNE